MSVTVRVFTKAQAEAERAELIASLPVPHDKAERFAMVDPETHRILRRIDSMDWLLQEEGTP